MTFDLDVVDEIGLIIQQQERARSFLIERGFSVVRQDHQCTWLNHNGWAAMVPRLESFIVLTDDISNGLNQEIFDAFKVAQRTFIIQDMTKAGLHGIPGCILYALNVDPYPHLRFLLDQ